MLMIPPLVPSLLKKVKSFTKNVQLNKSILIAKKQGVSVQIRRVWAIYHLRYTIFLRTMQPQSLQNRVLDVLTCFACSHVCLPTCLACFRVCVFSCLACSACLHARVIGVLACLRAPVIASLRFYLVIYFICILFRTCCILLLQNVDFFFFFFEIIEN